MSTRIDLNGIWKLTWRPIDGATGVSECGSPIDAHVPGDVHQDLVNAGLLPEPLVGVNAPKHEWIERAVFTYEREIRMGAGFERAELVASGVDCLAEVYLDSQLVGSSANAFVPHLFDITPFVRRGRKQLLRIDVDTGVQWGRSQDRSKYLNHDDYERMFLRKPQFSFKWDWAPRLVTCGLWRGAEIRLHKHAAIRDVGLDASFEAAAATLTAKAQIEAFSAGTYLIKLSVSRGSESWTAQSELQLAAGANEAEACVRIDPVERWFPVGYGNQALYDVRVELERAGQCIDERSTTYGFREVTIRQEPISAPVFRELVPETPAPSAPESREQAPETPTPTPSAPESWEQVPETPTPTPSAPESREQVPETPTGKSFIINVNGIDIFCKGASWVPVDSIPARITAEKYGRLVAEAVEANFNMFRIWGGGIYEDEAFYDLCDRLGVMIWHDFMFACTEYPDDLDWFVENVRDEAAKAVKRLRDHPSIVLWCGNNENDWLYRHWERENEPSRHGTFYGTAIYHQVLPQICAALDPKRPYWPSSPFGGDDPNSQEEGDCHAWNVSILIKDKSERADIRKYREERGKFISEYGVLSYALPRTILDYTGDPAVDFNSSAYKFHENRFDQGLTSTYLEVGFGSIPEDKRTFIDWSMAYQAMGLREAICQFRTRKFDCAGSLFWMYSDCWGTLGWTIVDYYLRRKPSFYWVRRAYAPIAVFVRVEDGVARSCVVNDTLADVPLTLKLEVGDLAGKGRGVEEKLVVPANGVAFGPELRCDKGYAYAAAARKNKLISEDLVLTHLPAEMRIPKVRLDTKTRQVGEELEVTVSANGFGHFVYLDLPDGAVPDDNWFNLLPSRPKVVRVRGAKADQVAVGCLNLA